MHLKSLPSLQSNHFLMPQKKNQQMVTAMCWPVSGEKSSSRNLRHKNNITISTQWCTTEIFLKHLGNYQLIHFHVFPHLWVYFDLPSVWSVRLHKMRPKEFLFFKTDQQSDCRWQRATFIAGNRALLHRSLHGC